MQKPKLLSQLPNPKPRNGRGNRSHWYPYYAGYSPSFVESVLEQLDINNDGVVLDPWNGSGTTTAVCQTLGLPALGMDLNPAMVVIGRARLLRDDAVGSLHALLTQILTHAQIKRGRGDVSIRDVNEPLTAWFDMPSARRIRAIEATILQVLCDTQDHQSVVKKIDGLSKLASFFYVLFFRVIRQIAGESLQTSNPTWQRASIRGARKLSAQWGKIEKLAVSELNAMVDGGMLQPGDWVDCDVKLGSAESIAMAEESASAVIGSPPYLTRIDYAAFTRIELAFLGVRAGDEFDGIRGALLGGAKNSISQHSQPLSAVAKSLLRKISKHKSKASSTYYFSYYSRFFAGYERSMQNVARVAKRNAPIVLVVQDSMYKEVHLDLAKLSIELMASSKFELMSRADFPCITSLRGMNSAARENAGVWRATESVLHFRRAS